MLSIDRVRTTTLSLLGLGASGIRPTLPRTGPDRGDHDDDSNYSPSPDSPFSGEDPVFAAVETALREAGYLDS